MTKKDFKAAMLRGLGRCVTMVQQKPEKYQDIVLWACKRDISYDAQSEGVRSWYVYTMANCYPDKEVFISAAAEALKKYRPNSGWNLLHLCELLMYFGMDGYESARLVVEEKYQELYADMRARMRRPNRIFHELADLEQLAMVLTVDEESFLRFAGDFGRLYREKKYMENGDFCWFFESEGKKYKRIMNRAAKENEDVASFVQRERACIATRWENWQKRKETVPENLKGFPLSRWLAKQADQEMLERYMRAYLETVQPELRADALEAFLCCPYPGMPQPVIEDTKSDCVRLRDAAWRVLENLREPSVRAFALENVEKGIRTPENFAILVTNYLPEDEKILRDLLDEMIAAKDWDGVHAAGLDIYRVFDEDIDTTNLKCVLPLLYEYNPCSCCRESALVYMSKHRMLTKEILEECRFDSNDDIRRYVLKRLKSGNVFGNN